MKSLALVLCFSVAAILAAPQYEECQTRNKIIYVEEYEDECHNEYREECSYTTEYVEKCTTEKKKVCEESWKDDGYGGRVWTEDESKCRWLEADKCKDVPQLVKKCEPKPERLCTKVHKNKPYQHECQYCGGEYRDCKRLDTNDDSYMPSSGSVISSDMPQPLAPQTTCNDKESEDLAIQLKEAVATAELLEGAIKSILSSFDLYTEKYDSNTGLPTENITLSDKPGIGKCFVEELSKRCFVESNEFKCDECGGVFGIPLTFCLNGGLSRKDSCKAGGGNTVYGGNVQFRRFSRPAPQRPPWSFFPRP